VTFVLDASIAGCWCFHDENDSRAKKAWDLLRNDRGLVPIHWWFEIGNLVLTGERRNRVTEQHATGFLHRLERFTIDIAPLPDRATVLALARKHRLTFYDAAYLELAHRENLPLATLDDDLAAAARAEGIGLIGSTD
jgi:predicted nucleic acid-binding protein